MPRSYQEIQTTCLRLGELWEDDEFPAVDESIFFSRKPPRPFQWKRPHEICKNPKLFVAGASRFDVQQGMLGNCWLLAAMASLSLYPLHFRKVVPCEQSFEKDYAGVFHFQIWQYGQWVDVVIDDRLPTYNGSLVFLHSKEKNEFWSALLEKAYAKLNGSYEALKGGQTAEAMEDFTGGLTEEFDLQKPPQNLLQIMLKGCARSSLMGCSVKAKPNEIEAKAASGLIKGHAYSVTAVKKVQMISNGTGQEIPLVRLRNPWGNEREWTGAWSDKSSEWKQLSDSEKQRLGLTFDNDGEFWMSFEDFCKNFSHLEVCSLGPDTMSAGGSRNRWECVQNSGRWVRGHSAGGCRNFPDTFACNPQFRISVADPDDDDDDNLCTVIINLMQKESRKKKRVGQKMLTIGYAVYKLTEEMSRKSHVHKDFFLYHPSTVRSSTFMNSREVSDRHKLPPGHYVIVPSTFDPNENGEFLLRLFSEKPAYSEAVDEETRYDESMLKVKVPPVKPQIRDKFRAMFNKLAGDDEEIDAYELQELLTTASKKERVTDTKFNIETCRSLVASMDDDKSGKIGFEEFLVVWQEFKELQKAFATYDRDGSNQIDAYELRDALRSIGSPSEKKDSMDATVRFRMSNTRQAGSDVVI